MKHIICMKWGDRYGPEFVNRLYSMVRRNVSGDIRFLCFTDDKTGLREEVETAPLPQIDLPERVKWLPWRKISLWQAPLADLTGEVLFLDVDLIVTGSLDEFFTYKPGKFVVAENWTQPGMNIGNTSVYRFPVGKYAYIYDNFQADPEGTVQKHGISQRYVSASIEDKEFWPEAWCKSFKHSLMPRFPMNWIKTPELPQDTKIVAFTGRPDPDEAMNGKWQAKWYKKTYKHVRPTPWIEEHWQ